MTQGYEAFNVVRRAADGIASTATAMATTLDTTVEQLFEGWTPAPPASDHTPPLRPQLHKHNRKAAAQHSQAEQTAESTDVDGGHASQTDGWDDWGSSFGSRSPSPDVLPSQSSAFSQQQSSIAAWRAAESGAQQPSEQQQTHATALCGTSASGASSARYSLMQLRETWWQSTPCRCSLMTIITKLCCSVDYNTIINNTVHVE